MRLCTAFLSLFFASHVAFAQSNVSDDYFKDWLSLSSYLRSKGVDPVGVNWLAIESMCLGLKKASNPIPYNKCKAEKALDQRQYGADSSGCDAQAQADYTERLKFRQPTRTLVVADQSGVKQVIDESAPGLTEDELKSLRRSTYLKCMRELGWSNPDNWIDGRRF